MVIGQIWTEKYNGKCNSILISSGTPTMAKTFKSEFIPEDSKVSLFLEEDLKIYKMSTRSVWNL